MINEGKYQMSLRLDGVIMLVSGRTSLDPEGLAHVPYNDGASLSVPKSGVEGEPAYERATQLVSRHNV